MTLLFDLDGTLADPLDAFRASLEHAFDAHAVTRPSEAQMRRAIGPPLHLSVREIMGAPEDKADAILKAYRAHHLANSLALYRLYFGVNEVLGRLARRHKLFVATSKPHEQAKPLLAQLGVAQHFTQIHGSEIDGTRSQKAELIAHVLKENAFDPDTTVMIGDRSYDILGAKANALKSIGVLWGYGSRAELEEAGADQIVGSFPELNFE